MNDNLRKRSLEYHAAPKPGKIGIQITKPVDTAEDLALAYTPGVAEPVREIAERAEAAYQYTAKGNLVAVVTDGTAVLGLGNVGPLAGKPVMEGKCVLFKNCANVDAFDIEVDAKDPAHFIEVVKAIAPTFGGINLEDIKGPECFAIEEALVSALDIPVFHDDQHGTAVTVAAGLLNALELQGKTLSESTLVCLGAGAAGVATMKLLLALGADPERLLVVDRQGVLYTDRPDLVNNPYKRALAIKTTKRTLADALQGADVFIGVSGANLLPADMLKLMANKPIIFALSNPDPEILPAAAYAVRSDLVMATGRSDYPNQVNNVLCFPYIFRGALDVRAKCIHPSMLVAAVEAIRDLAREPVPEVVRQAYAMQNLQFGPDYILPKPNDPRLIERVPARVAQAAVQAQVARLPYPSFYPVL